MILLLLMILYIFNLTYNMFSLKEKKTKKLERSLSGGLLEVGHRHKLPISLEVGLSYWVGTYSIQPFILHWPLVKSDIVRSACPL